MDFAAFRKSLAEAAPPTGLSAAAQGLWWQGKGDWQEAHRAAQQQADAEGAWVHAHLHRVEGDLSNARFWYARAGRPASTAPFEEEWEEIAKTLLG